MSKRDKTIEQVEAAQRKAVRFVENVLRDDDKAAEIASLTPEEYADRKRLRIINPTATPTTERNRLMPKQPTRAELMERIEELEEENASMSEQLDNIAQIVTPEDDDQADDDDEGEYEEDEEEEQ